MSKLTKTLNSKLTSEKVERKGENIHIVSKWCMFIGLCGFALLALICLISLIIYDEDSILLILRLKLTAEFKFLNPIVFLCYLSISGGIIGISTYFFGIILFSLGRIAKNSDIQTSSFSENEVSTPREIKSTSNTSCTNNTAINSTINNNPTINNMTKEIKESSAQKKCWACGTIQPESNKYCRNCNETI